MSFDGFMSDDPIPASYMLGSITKVDTSKHTIDIQLYRFHEPLTQVPLFRPPGNLSLPHVGDIALVIWDDREKPACIGVYPQFIADGIEDKRDYNTQKGDVVLQSFSEDAANSEKRGGRLILKENPPIIKLVNQQDQGIEIDEKTGSVYLIASSVKERLGVTGVIERKGVVKRQGSLTSGSGYSLVTLDFYDNEETGLRKSGSIDIVGVLSSSVGNQLYEKRIEVKVPGSITALTPNGQTLYKETIGASVIGNNAVAGVYSEEVHSTSGLPLRKEVVFYNSTGTTELVREEIDALGSVYIYISPGVEIEIDSTTGNISIDTPGTISITGSAIELNGATYKIGLAGLIATAFNVHTHTETGGITSTPITVWSESTVGSTTVKAT